jgi:hypothetical protein
VPKRQLLVAKHVLLGICLLAGTYLSYCFAF